MRAHTKRTCRAGPFTDVAQGDPAARRELRAMIRANLTPGEMRDLDVYNVAKGLCDMLHVAGVAIPEGTDHRVSLEVSAGGRARVVRDSYDDADGSLDDIAESADWDRVWTNFRRMILFWMGDPRPESDWGRGYDVRYFARVMTRYYDAVFAS